MRSQDKIAERKRGAGKNVCGGAILGEIRFRLALIDLAFHQFRGAGEAASLVTDRRQNDPVSSGGIPDKFLFSAIDRMDRIRSFQPHSERARRAHGL